MSRSTRRQHQVRSRRQPRVLIAVTVAVVALVGVAALNSGGSTDDDLDGTALSSPKQTVVPVIDFEMLDGATGSFRNYQGRPLVVNFFASWCFSCLAELPGFETVHQDLQGQVRFLGLNLQDRPEDGRKVVEDTGITYDVGRDADGELFRAFKGLAMPTTAFVDANGRIVDVHSGELSAQALRDRITAELLS